MEKFKLIHTADIHIQSKDDRGFKALDEILENSKKQKVAAVFITGDLFENDKCAFEVRTEIKELFESHKSTRIFLTSGNHDEKSYSQNINYGANTCVLSKTPYEKIEINSEITIYGVPFQRGMDISKALEAISSDTEKKQAFKILLSHGTLIDQWLKDILVYLSKYESDSESFFIHGEDFNKYDINLVLLGHYHNFIEKNYGQTLVSYAGTPQTTSIKNAGKRRASLIEIDVKNKTSTIEPVFLDLPYIITENLRSIPGKEETLFEHIENYIKNSDIKAEIAITIEGFTKTSERDFQDSLNKIEKKFTSRALGIKLNNKTKQVSAIQGNAMAGRFLKMWEKSFEKSDSKNLNAHYKALDFALSAFQETLLKKKS